MLVPIFTLKLNQKIFPRLVTVGSYDGKHPCLTGATNGGKVFIHMPHNRSSSQTELVGGGAGAKFESRMTVSSDLDVMLLSFGQHITALTAGILDPSLGNDVLLVGSQTNLLVYDVETNADLFYKDLPDGANSILVGQFSEEDEPIALVGGNCAIQGYDSMGEDKYWTVTGDNVCCMSLVDYDSDGQKELLVGSEDYELRVFKNDELYTEMSESDVVISLCPIQNNRFAYSLISGEVGVYGGAERFWRVKSKSQPMCMHAYDIDGDGVLELVTGWSTGKMDIRSVQTGNVMYKDTFSSHIAGIVQADYRLEGREDLICCSIDGEVRGYLPPSQDTRVGESSSEEHSQALEELHRKKYELLLQLQNYEVNEKVAGGSKQVPDVAMGTIPAGTLIKTHYSACLPVSAAGEEPEKARVELTIETNNNTILRAAVIFAECLFEGESHVVHPPPNKLGSSLKVPLFPEKDTPTDLHVKAFVGHPSSSQFHVFEATRPLPRFSLYIPCGLDVQNKPAGSVTFNLNERLDRVLAWISENFLYEPGEGSITSPKLQVAYMSLRTSSPVLVNMDPSDNGKTTIATDDMDLAGDMIQSLATHFSIEDLSSVADFPHQMEDLRTLLKQVDDLHKVRQQLTAEMADNAGVIGNLVVRAEDARMMNHIGNMKKAYSQLYNLNKDLMMGYKIRSNNHMQLLECLKTVNQAIQKAGRLRVGKSKSHVVTACRAAIKNNDVEGLIKVIKNGAPS